MQASWQQPGPVRSSRPRLLPSSLLDRKVNPRWQPLVSALKDYVTRAYVKYDKEKAKSALELLKANGITEDEMSPLQNSNRFLMPKDMFLTYFYIESPAIMPVIKLFLIARARPL